MYVSVSVTLMQQFATFIRAVSANATDTQYRNDAKISVKFCICDTTFICLVALSVPNRAVLVVILKDGVVHGEAACLQCIF